MAVDPSKLKRFGRRGLGSPPTDGSPGIEGSAATTSGNTSAEAARHPIPPFRQADVERSGADVQQAMPPTKPPARIPAEPTPSAAAATWDPVPASTEAAALVSNGAGEGTSEGDLKFEEELGISPGPRRLHTTAGRGSARQVEAQPRQRVPPPEAEPRIPFTTRIAASTKERLEDACYHLRTKHQAFIDEAIRIHLKKHGF